MLYKYNYTVGPSKLYDGAADFICQSLRDGLGELSHRSADFSAMSEQTLKNMRQFFGIPTDYQVYYTASATEGMEITLRNGVDKKSCHVVNGNFGELWAKQAIKTKKQVQKNANEDGTRVKITDIKPDEDAEMLCLTANETATGIAYSPEEIAEIHSLFPDKLLAVDVTSAMGAVAYDFTVADAWFFSVQKAFGMPAGLGILIVSPRFQEKAKQHHESDKDVGCHHSIVGLHGKMDTKFQTPTTPNVINIATLGFLCESLIKDYGDIKKLYAKTKAKAEKIYDFFDADPKFQIPVSKGRSVTTIVISADEAYLNRLHERAKAKNMIIGRGYGPAKPTQLRIANFPAHRDHEALFAVVTEMG